MVILVMLIMIMIGMTNDTYNVLHRYYIDIIGMVQTRSQFEFCLMAVAEETHAILKALPQ